MAGASGASRHDPGRPVLIKGTPTTEAGSSSQHLSFTAPAGIKILGYGDSLTAGWHDDGVNLTPYAPKLEEALGERLGNGTDVLVKHKGLSGWTAKSMLDAKDEEGIGLRAIIQRANGGGQALTAVVIIAGTNDLANFFTPDEIAENVLGLHAIAHQQGVKTISVDVPENAAAMQNKEYAALRAEVNAKLLQSSLQDTERIHIPCPIKFAYDNEKGGELWEQDGLHMSGPGYEALGEGLAPMVEGALKGWGIL